MIEITTRNVQALIDRDIDSASSWSQARAEAGHMWMPTTSDRWLSVVNTRCNHCYRTLITDGNDQRITERAGLLSGMLQVWRIGIVLSVGCGAAGLEYHLKRENPEVELHLSDYDPVTLHLVGDFFRDARSAFIMDLTAPDWSLVSGLSNALVLMNRVDPHLTDDEWRACFASAHAVDVRQILFIPNRIATLLSIARSLGQRLWWWVTRRPTGFAGYVRTRARLESLWSEWYEGEPFECAGKTAYRLTRRSHVASGQSTR